MYRHSRHRGSNPDGPPVGKQRGVRSEAPNQQGRVRHPDNSNYDRRKDKTRRPPSHILTSAIYMSNPSDRLVHHLYEQILR